MGVSSKNKGNPPPKSSILIGFSLIFTIHFGGKTPIFGSTPISRYELLQAPILWRVWDWSSIRIRYTHTPPRRLTASLPLKINGVGKWHFLLKWSPSLGTFVHFREGVYLSDSTLFHGGLLRYIKLNKLSMKKPPLLFWGRYKPASLLWVSGLRWSKVSVFQKTSPGLRCKPWCHRVTIKKNKSSSDMLDYYIRRFRMWHDGFAVIFLKQKRKTHFAPSHLPYLALLDHWPRSS